MASYLQVRQQTTPDEKVSFNQAKLNSFYSIAEQCKNQKNTQPDNTNNTPAFSLRELRHEIVDPPFPSVIQPTSPQTKITFKKDLCIFYYSQRNILIPNTGRNKRQAASRVNNRTISEKEPQPVTGLS